MYKLLVVLLIGTFDKCLHVHYHNAVTEHAVSFCITFIRAVT